MDKQLWYEFITEGCDIDYKFYRVPGFNPLTALITYCEYSGITGAHLEAICSICFESAIQLANEWLDRKIINIHEVGEEIFLTSDCNIIVV